MGNMDDYIPKNDWRSIPQNIRYIASDPCGTDPWIMVALALPAVSEAVLTLVSFGLSDIAIGYTHPAKRYGLIKRTRARDRFGRGEPAREPREQRPLKEERKPSRDGELRRIRGEGMPEVGNEIGKLLPGSRLIRGLQMNKKAWWFWLPVDLIEHGLYWWMIADIAKDATYHWASDIHKSECNDHQPRDNEFTAAMMWSGLSPDFAMECPPHRSLCDRWYTKNMHIESYPSNDFTFGKYGTAYFGCDLFWNLWRGYTTPHRVHYRLQADIWHKGWVTVQEYDEMIEPGGAVSINFAYQAWNCRAFRTQLMGGQLANAEGDVSGYLMIDCSSWEIA